MNIITLVAVLALQQPWEPLGPSASFGLLDGGACADVPSAAFDVDGNPVVAWTQSSENRLYIYLKKWNGLDRWIEVGGASASGGGVSGMLTHDLLSASEPRLVIERGTYYLAWKGTTSDTTISNVYLSRYSGGSWGDLGGSSSGRGITQSSATCNGADIAVDAGARPYVSWVDGRTTRLCMLYWDGTGWKGLGGSATGVDDGTGVTGASLSVTPSGEPVLAWRDGPGHAYGVHCRKWQAGTWSDFGVVVDHAIQLQAPRVKVGRDNHAFITWYEENPGEVYTADCVLATGRWTITSLGNVSQTETWSYMPTMAVNDRGYPVVAWTEILPGPGLSVYELFVRHWDGHEWREMRGAAADGGIELNPEVWESDSAIAVSASGGTVLAWSEQWPGKARCCARRRVNPAAEISGLGQGRLSNADDLPPGGITWGDPGFSAIAHVASPETGRAILQVEVRPLGTPFAGTPTAMAATGVEDGVVRLPVSGLLPGPYHWQARAMNDAGITGWVSMGGHPEGTADFSVRNNTAPVAGTADQRDPERDVTISVGGTIRTRGTITLVVSVNDADGDDVLVEIEVKPQAEPFDGHVTASGTAASGSTARIPVPVSVGGFHWRFRTLDAFSAASAWTSFGGNAESAADFFAMADGSIGPASCVSSAPAGAGLMAALAVLLLWRRCR